MVVASPRLVAGLLRLATSCNDAHSCMRPAAGVRPVRIRHCRGRRFN